MKIYDCFTFFNELDLLELRFAELYDHVDHFVLVEANRTFQNNPKSFYFMENLKRFEPYLDKVIHYTVADMPEDTDAWGRERYQRDAIVRAVVYAEPEDIIMIGDADEIPRVETIRKLRDSKQSIWGFRMPLFNFKFNYMMCTQDYYSVWSGAVRRDLLNSPEDFRRMRHMLNQCAYDFKDDNIQIIEHAGWHFTYLGTENFAKDKIQSFAHQETNRPDVLDQLDINESIKQGVGIIRSNMDYLFKAVKLDNYFPNTVINNPVKYKNYILDGANESARDLLPR